MKNKLIKIHESDNVAIAITGLKKGENAKYGGVVYTAQNDIPVNHKIALRSFQKDEIIIKYGNPIGVATQCIQKGEWVHSHNMRTGLDGMLEYRYQPTSGVKNQNKKVQTFQGYLREDGNVGTRNEIWIIPTVACVNQTTRILAERAAEKYGHLCEGIYAYPHNAGCSQLGTDHEITQKILASIVRHPNAGGVLLVSLGCENNNLKEFKPVLGDIDESRIKFMICQEEEDELERGLELIGEIAEQTAKDRRTQVPVSKLKIGFKCGGSDALSGVTANPLCGQVANRVVEQGGIAILTEVPEMFGAETILMNRADTEETFEKIVDLINSFKQYYMDYGQPIYENPAPGNKEGGITTLEEKSLGCIQKGGDAIVTDTLMYGERASIPGLNLMNGPGNDSVSVTNLVAAGAQLLLFTTGRGNPLGTSIPSVKIASNTELYNKKSHWFDFNAGTLVNGDTLENMGDSIWNLILEIASGEKKTKNEENGYKDIMIFKNGVLL